MSGSVWMNYLGSGELWAWKDCYGRWNDADCNQKQYYDEWNENEFVCYVEQATLIWKKTYCLV